MIVTMIQSKGENDVSICTMLQRKRLVADQAENYIEIRCVIQRAQRQSSNNRNDTHPKAFMNTVKLLCHVFGDWLRNGP